MNRIFCGTIVLQGALGFCRFGAPFFYGLRLSKLSILYLALTFMAIYFSLGRLSADQLQEMTDFMKQHLDPEARAFLVSQGVFKALQQAVTSQKTLDDTLSDDASKSVFSEMKRILSAA